MPISKHVPAHRKVQKASNHTRHTSISVLREEVGQKAYNRETRNLKHWSQWYYTPTWKKLRAAHRKKEPRCRLCGSGGRIVVDHIEDHKGDWNMFTNRANLQSLCQSCHNRKTHARQGARPIQGNS